MRHMCKLNSTKPCDAVLLYKLKIYYLHKHNKIRFSFETKFTLNNSCYAIYVVDYKPLCSIKSSFPGMCTSLRLYEDGKVKLLIGSESGTISLHVIDG